MFQDIGGSKRDAAWTASHGLQCGTTEGVKSEITEIPEPQLGSPSKSGSASCATIGGSLDQVTVDPYRSMRLINKVDNRLQQLYPMMPKFLFQRILSRQAQLVNELSRLTVKHAEHVSQGTCPSGKLCSYRGTLSSFPTNVREPAKQFPAIMECLVCFKTQLFETRASWTNHLYADVKPYFCTAYPCRSTIQFSSKQDWLRHEMEDCRKQYWRCDLGKYTTTWDWRCDSDECTTMWVDQTEFRTHLVEEHCLPEDDKLDSIQQRCGRDFYRQKKTCLFCGLCGHDDFDTHVAQHMDEISKYVLHVVQQQDPIEQGEANQKYSTFPSIQSHPPTFSRCDIARTVPDENVEIPLLQPFKAAQSTTVSHDQSLRSPLTIKYEQPNGSLLHPLGKSSNQHLQSQGAPISLTESAPLSRESSMVYNIGPYQIFDRLQSGTPDTPLTGQTTYVTSSIQDENSMSSLSSRKR